MSQPVSDSRSALMNAMYLPSGDQSVGWFVRSDW
jgi:hypothetical protein